MAFTTHAEFKTEIEEWLDRPDLSAKIDSFIDIAEATIRRRCKGLEREVRAQATVTAGQRYVALPTDYRGMKNLSIRPEDGGGYLEQRTPDELDRLTERNALSSSTSTPFWYALNGNELELSPVAGADIILEMTYIETLSPISPSGTNLVFDRHPDIYLYATLCAASYYTVEDRRVPLWKASLTEAVNEYNGDAEQRKYGAAPLRMRPALKTDRRVTHG